MSISSISNVSSFKSLSSIVENKSTDSETFIPFKDVLNNAIDNVNITDEINKKDILNIAAGQTDNLHTVMIDSAKADLALQTLVQVRNKALDAYNEIMRITL